MVSQIATHVNIVHISRGTLLLNALLIPKNTHSPFIIYPKHLEQRAVSISLQSHGSRLIKNSLLSQDSSNDGFLKIEHISIEDCQLQDSPSTNLWGHRISPFTPALLMAKRY